MKSLSNTHYIIILLAAKWSFTYNVNNQEILVLVNQIPKDKELYSTSVW